MSDSMYAEGSEEQLWWQWSPGQDDERDCVSRGGPARRILPRRSGGPARAEAACGATQAPSKADTGQSKNGRSRLASTSLATHLSDEDAHQLGV
jgi:hypothetical protein